MKRLSFVMISVLGIIIYANTFHCSFHLDDQSSVIYNFTIRDIHYWPNIWNFLPRRFLLYLSLALNYHFSALDVFGYHLFNLGVHLGTAILVWWLTLLTFSTPAMKNEKIAQYAETLALLAGLVFVAHPIQTEAVTYIVQRAASMAAMFYVASLCLWVQSRLLQDKNPAVVTRKFYYAGALCTAVMAMFTKETAITLPLIIVLYELCFFKTKKNFNWQYAVPFLMMVFIIPLTMLLTETRPVRLQELSREPGISSIHYLLTQFRVMVTYARLAFLPVHQNLDYDYPVFKSFFQLPVITSFLFLLMILCWAKHLFSKHRVLAFSIFWFFLTIVPESSVVPIKDVIFEHRLYLPLVGYSMFLVCGAYYLWRGKHFRTMIKVLLVIIAWYAILTYQRNKVWENEITLWNDTLRKSPHAARPYNGLGMAYETQGELPLALFNFNKAIEIDPNFTEAYNNRGNVYSKQGRFTQALSDFNKTIELDPNFGDAYNNRGNLYSQQGNFTQALSDFNKAIEINPGLAWGFYDRAICYVKQGNVLQALADYNRVMAIDPNIAEAYNNRGILYAEAGRLTQALSDYNRAIQLNPNSAEAYNDRGNVYYQQGQFIQAIADYSKAIEINPNFARFYYNRLRVYYALKEYGRAWQDVHKAEALGAVVDPAFISLLKAVSVGD